MDEEYDQLIPPNFTPSTMYIRQTKRIDEEADLLVDYCIEDDDKVVCHILSRAYS
jgi:hypothetical protein